MIKTLLGHIVLILSGMYAVFYFIDRVNPAMEFINNDITKAILLALSVFAAILAACTVHDRRALKRKRLEQDEDYIA